MSRHVLFVHAPIPGARFNSSVAALSAWLEAHGHTTAMLIVPPDADPRDTLPLFRDAAPDVVAFSYMTCRADAVPDRGLPRVGDRHLGSQNRPSTVDRSAPSGVFRPLPATPLTVASEALKDFSIRKAPPRSSKRLAPREWAASRSGGRTGRVGP